MTATDNGGTREKSQIDRSSRSDPVELEIRRYPRWRDRRREAERHRAMGPGPSKEVEDILASPASGRHSAVLRRRRSSSILGCPAGDSQKGSGKLSERAAATAPKSPNCGALPAAQNIEMEPVTSRLPSPEHRSDTARRRTFSAVAGTGSGSAPGMPGPASARH